jgi:hypothetical protein
MALMISTAFVCVGVRCCGRDPDVNGLGLLGVVAVLQSLHLRGNKIDDKGMEYHAV